MCNYDIISLTGCNIWNILRTIKRVVFAKLFVLNQIISLQNLK